MTSIHYDTELAASSRTAIVLNNNAIFRQCSHDDTLDKEHAFGPLIETITRVIPCAGREYGWCAGLRWRLPSQLRCRVSWMVWRAEVTRWLRAVSAG